MSAADQATTVRDETNRLIAIVSHWNQEVAHQLGQRIDELFALAERATELEILAAERARERDEDAHSLNHCRGLLEAVEARATELERERDLRMQGQFKMQDERDVWRERAERAETALRQIVALADNPSRHYDDLGMSDIARAALGETAPNPTALSPVRHIDLGETAP